MKHASMMFSAMVLFAAQAQAAPLTAQPMSTQERALTPAAPQSYGAVEYPTTTESRTGRYVLGNWQLHPGIGFTAINSTAGFNVGSYIAYRVLDAHPLHFEPGFWLGFFENQVMFNFMAGARYDIVLSETWLKPFAKVSVGTTLKTKGDAMAFNAYVGLGVLYPVNKKLDFRADAGLQNIDGDAGFLLTAGIGF